MHKKRTFTLLSILVLALALMTASLATAETDGGRSAAGAAQEQGQPAQVDWSDDFDSYATDLDLHGVGGWKGWDNNPAFTAFTRDEQALSAPNSVEIVGASDLVQVFEEDETGQWTMTAWQYIPANLTGQTYFIIQNTYNDFGPYSWSTQVLFDPATDQVQNTGVSGGTLAIKYDQWVEIRVEVDLDNDTQSFYYDDQLLYQGTWTNEVSVGGALDFGALDLFANGASAVYYDDISLVEAGGANVIFADNWESGDLSAWDIAQTGGGDLDATAAAALEGAFGMEAIVDDTARIFVADDSPTSETHYNATFLFDPNSITIPAGTPAVLFVAADVTAAQLASRPPVPLFALQFGRAGSNYGVLGVVREDNGAVNTTAPGLLLNGTNTIEIDWQAGAGSGTFTLSVNGTVVDTLTGLDNDAQQVEIAALGLPLGAPAGTSGSLYFDTFVSVR